MKLSIFILLLSSTIGWAKTIPPVEFKCDEQKEITPKLALKKVPHDSENFRKVYTGIRFDFENSIHRICEYLKRCEFNPQKETDEEIRKNYAATASGKKTLSDLDVLRKQFGFNTVDAYMFGEQKINTLGNLKITHKLKKGDRTFYLDDVTIVGYFDQVGEVGVLTRYDRKCNIAELVSFTSLTNFENPVSMKVTKKYCTTSQNKGPAFKFTEEMLREMGAYMQRPDGVEVQMEAQQMCEQWTPKTEPLGMVIDATAPSPAASTKKMAAHGKKKPHKKTGKTR